MNDLDSDSDAEEEGEGESSAADATALQQMLGSASSSDESPGLGDGAGPSGLQNLPVAVADSSGSDGDDDLKQAENPISTLPGTWSGAGPSGLQNLPVAVADSSGSDGDDDSKQAENPISTLPGTSSIGAEEFGTTESQGGDTCRTEEVKEVRGDSPKQDQPCPSAESLVESQEKLSEEQLQPTNGNQDEVLLYSLVSRIIPGNGALYVIHPCAVYKYNIDPPSPHSPSI